MFNLQGVCSATIRGHALIIRIQLIQNKAYDKKFLSDHVNIKKTVTDIGYGLRPEHPLEVKAKNSGKGKLSGMSFDEYAKAVSEYTLEYTSKHSKVPEEKLLRLAKLYLITHKAQLPFGGNISTETNNYGKVGLLP